jgi:Protein of unknown function (DUF732)
VRLKHAAVTVALMAGAVGLAAPAAADDQGFIDAMNARGIGSDHGFIDNNSREAKAVLGSGHGVCNRLHDGWPWINVQRNLITAEATDHAMVNGRDLNRDDIDYLIHNAQEHLCPDTL